MAGPVDRRAAGPGWLAGLVLAVSTAAVDESTFIWNPNLIALSSGLALAGTWLAWRGGSPWWWVRRGHRHGRHDAVPRPGVALLPVVAVPLVLDARRRRLGRPSGSAIVGVFVAAYLPLLVNELTTSFSETRAALAYLAGGREAEALPLPIRFPIVGLRVVSLAARRADHRGVRAGASWPPPA